MMVCECEETCLAWNFIRVWFPFWKAVEHCPFFRFETCIMSEDDKKAATESYQKMQTFRKKYVMARTVVSVFWFLWAYFKWLKGDHPYNEFECFLAQKVFWKIDQGFWEVE